MVDQIIRPADLPNRANPVASEKIPVDNGVSVGGATIQSIVESGRPAASQSEAEAGVNSVKAMTPLTTKQSIASEVGVTIASKAQGDKADSAIQEVVAGSNIAIDNTDPQRPVVNSSGSPSVGFKSDIVVIDGQTDWRIARNYKTVSNLLADDGSGDMGMGYAGAGANVIVSPGDIVTAQGFRYEVAASDAVDAHVETAGGVKLYVLPLGDDSFNLLQFGVDASGPISLQLPTEVAAGRKIVIPAGDWSVMNADLTGAWLEFSEGAKFVSVLGADDNGINTSGRTKITGYPHFVVSNTATPADGGLGNIITMGTYVTNGEVFDGLEIHSPVFECLNSSAMGLAISCLGRAENVRIYGQATLRGRFSGGFQAHWGGVFDGGDPHNSNVTESYHPNNIKIDTLVLEKGGPNNLGGHLGLSLSAAYDVEVGTIINNGWDRTDWIQPGDVYDLVAAPDQKDKIMSGIRVQYTEIINPVANTSTYNNILVSGVSATIRVAGQTSQVCAADRQNMAVDHGEVRVICLPGYTYDTGPIARTLYAKNSKIDVTFEGFGSGITSTLFQSVASVDCEVKVAGASAAPLLSGFANIGNKYYVEWKSPVAHPSNLPGTHRVVTLGAGGGTATIGSAVSVGATSITISTWSGVSPGIVPKGTRLYLPNRSWVTLSRSQSIGTGATTLQVERLTFTISSGTTLSASCRELDSILDGYVEAARTAIELTNVDGVEVPAYIRRSGKFDVLLSGTVNRRVKFNGIYDECGQLNDGSLLVNIHLGDAGVLSEFLDVRGAKFEQSGAPLVSNNVYGRASNNAHIGLIVTDCDLDSLSHPVNYLWPTDAAVLNAGPPQVFGNRRKGAMSAAGYDFDPAQGATAYIGGVYHVFRNVVPGAGIWPVGSKWINLQAEVGQSKGSIRTTAGTWVSEGNL